MMLHLPLNLSESDQLLMQCQVSHDDKNARAAVTTRHSYSVQVAPGTDCVLMIAAAMAIEDLYAK